MAGEKTTSDLVLIKDYFGYREGTGAGEFLKELKALSPEDKAQLAEGIRNGTLTY